MKPATKEGEKERPHQAGCICYRCEDWDKAHEPAKVEAGGLPPLDEAYKAEQAYALTLESSAQYTITSQKAEIKCRERQLQASLLREQKLKELLGEAANAIGLARDIARYCDTIERPMVRP